jgi:hypothetical protein
VTRLAVFPIRVEPFPGVARSLLRDALPFCFSPTAPSYWFTGRGRPFPLAFVPSHLRRVSALKRFFGSWSSSQHGFRAVGS